MRANINPETGIPYGVIDARSCQWLWETIVNEGRDVTAEAHEEQVRKELERNLASDLGEYEVNPKLCSHSGSVQFYLFVLAMLNRYPQFFPKDRTEEVARAVLDEVYDDASNTFSISEAIEFIWKYYADEWLYGDFEDTSEHTFAWEQDGRFSYQVSSLGGAPLIWVFKSPYVTPCRQCSPCVPNAGNLDDMMELGAHNCLAYCMDPEEIDDVIARPKVMYYATEYPQTDKPITYLQKETNV
jgi:hypothetical protein